ncbi:MAG: hypothetical protein JNM56_10325 [Planctomycetia bacterium]|nr:hypothetical protein [Planctomycetia bacterium]
MAFVWRVSLSGYCLKRQQSRQVKPKLVGPADAEAGDYLLPNGPWRYREYEPLKEYPGLFRTFADTPADGQGILNFANQYGHLGDQLGEGVEIDPTEVESEEEWDQFDAAIRDDTPVEDFDRWTDAIKLMKEMVGIWQKLTLNEADEGIVTRLQTTVSRELRGRLEVVLQRNPKLGVSKLQIVPQNLLGALWLQLAQAVDSGKELRACQTCGRWFEVSLDAFRKSRSYCGESCRSKAYRQRKEQAVQLAAAGKKPQDIAKEVGSDLASIRKWLKAAK